MVFIYCFLGYVLGQDAAKKIIKSIKKDSLIISNDVIRLLLNKTILENFKK